MSEKIKRELKPDFSFHQVRGRLRRMYVVFLRRKHADKLLAKRKGDCARCGACCKLVFQCPFYTEIDGLSACKIHQKRPPVCRYFPMDYKDMADRNRVNPDQKCGYHFD